MASTLAWSGGRNHAISVRLNHSEYWMDHPIHHEAIPPGCPVVYVPGVDGTGRLLFRQQDLSARHKLRCVSYPQDCCHDYADLVKLGIAQLEETGPGVLLAESFGGAVALLIALERPDLVRRLILVSTFAYYPRRLIIDALALIGPWLPSAPSHPITRDVRGFFFFAPGVSKADQDAWWDLTADVPMDVYGHRFTLIAGLDLRSRLRDIEIPTLVFAAPNDWVVPCTASHLLARRLPRAKLLMAPTGHAAMIDQRVNVAAWLASEKYWKADASNGWKS